MGLLAVALMFVALCAAAGLILPSGGFWQFGGFLVLVGVYLAMMRKVVG